MGKNVYANGREISCKKDDNKSICSMPDVCLSPPSPPAGPLPIPYPNTAMASDTSDGSKTVKIGGDEVGLKNASSYKKSTGDEAATKSFGMGVVSHNIQGKLKHAAWSMDVNIEGANAIRHMDMVTQNHMNNTNACPGIDLAGMAPPAGDPECVELENGVRQDSGNDTKPYVMKKKSKRSKKKVRRPNPNAAKLAPNTVMTRANSCGQTVKASTPMTNIRGGKTASGYLTPKPLQGLQRDPETGLITKGGTEPTIACSKQQYSSKGSGGGGAPIPKRRSSRTHSRKAAEQHHDADQLERRGHCGYGPVRCANWPSASRSRSARWTSSSASRTRRASSSRGPPALTPPVNHATYHSALHPASRFADEPVTHSWKGRLSGFRLRRARRATAAPHWRDHLPRRAGAVSRFRRVDRLAFPQALQRSNAAG